MKVFEDINTGFLFRYDEQYRRRKETNLDSSQKSLFSQFNSLP